MSETTKKRPAHEVLLEKVQYHASRYRTEAEMPVNDGWDGIRKDLNLRSIYEVINTLIEVLREMVIPEKELESVIRSLEGSADLANYVPRAYSGPTPRILITNLVSVLKVA